MVAATGRRGQNSEPVAFVYGTAAGGDGRLPTIGRTVCGKSARTGLWGCRRATAGTTRNSVLALRHWFGETGQIAKVSGHVVGVPLGLFGRVGFPCIDRF